MATDSVRLLATYAIAILVLVGSFVLLMVPSQVPSEQLVPFITGIIGIIVGWAFQKEGTAAAQRSTERAVSLGQNNPPTGP